MLNKHWHLKIWRTYVIIRWRWKLIYKTIRFVKKLIKATKIEVIMINWENWQVLLKIDRLIKVVDKKYYMNGQLL